MSLPSKDDVCQLGYGMDGVPFVNVAGNTGTTTLAMDFGRNGVPFVATEAILGPPVGQNGYVAIVVMG